jgi:hypothetical protein
MRQAILQLALCGLALGGCIVDVEGYRCFDGEIRCHDDFVQECVDNRWEVFDDCRDLCSGTCEYVHGEPVCVC